MTDNWKIVISSCRRDMAGKVQFVLKGFGKRLNYDSLGSAVKFMPIALACFPEVSPNHEFVSLKQI